METLEEKVLRVLGVNGPMAFDAIKTELKVSDDELTDAINKLKGSGHIESIKANAFCWSLAPMH